MVCTLHSQDTLPNFVVKNVGPGRNIISWNNRFPVIRQISIQRSSDSTKSYKTILTVLDPTLPQNGYLDTKAPYDMMFYRLYILADKGQYLFSAAKKPIKDTTQKVVPVVAIVQKLRWVDSTMAPNGDSLSAPMVESPIRNKPPPFVPSKYVYAYKDGYVQVDLPGEDKEPGSKPTKKYNIKFFDAEDNFLFELKDIKNRHFKLDKTNFYHAGWFKFQLYEEGKMIEMHKFFLSKPF